MLMVENEVISIMDEGLGDEIDILVSELEYPELLDSLSGAGASYQVQVNHNPSIYPSWRYKSGHIRA